MSRKLCCPHCDGRLYATEELKRQLDELLEALLSIRGLMGSFRTWTDADVARFRALIDHAIAQGETAAPDTDEHGPLPTAADVRGILKGETE